MAAQASSAARQAVERGTRRMLEPADPGIRSIQPGGGVCMTIELAWGRLRRSWLETFRRRHVARMAALRRGARGDIPHQVLDSRDLKFHGNLGSLHWPPECDPFHWREKLPFARAGLAELVLIGGSSLAAAAGLAFWWWPAALVPAAAGLLVAWFFRDPERTPPSGPGLVLAPADGRVAEVEEISHDDYLDAPGIRIGIFLSVFDVHVNRAPVGARVIGLGYRPGRFLNALRPAAAAENQALELRLEESLPPHRGFRVRQVAGAVARRIVCSVAPGAELERGERFGMIKLGSRTEIVLPREAGLEILAHRGQRVRAGETVLARYSEAGASEPPGAAP